MKKILFMLSLVASFLLISCSSSENKAKKLINNYLQENLKDARSYESIKFGSLDSVFSTYKDDPKYIELNESCKYLEMTLDIKLDVMKNFDEYERDFVDEAKKDADSLLNILKKNNGQIEDILNNHKSEFIGWKMSHKYRAKNGFGAMGIDETVFYFDKDIKSIKRTEDY